MQILTRATALIFGVAACAASANAAEYTAGGTFDVGASYNDNIRLAQDNETAVHKYKVAPTLTLSRATEVSQIKLDSIFNFNRYDKSEFDSNDQDFTLALTRQFENNSIGVNAAYIKSSTITSELLTTGRIGNKAERAETYQLSPHWLHNINETNLIQIQANYTAQDYRSDAYTGYDNTGTEISWMYKISERMSWITTATYSDYQSDDVVIDVPSSDLLLPFLGSRPAGYYGQQSYSVRTKNTGANIGVNFEWSEQTSLEASLGRSKSRTTYPIKNLDNPCAHPEYPDAALLAELIGRSLSAICDPIPDVKKLSTTADIAWRWKNERQQISVTGTKATQPTSNGYAIDATRIGSNWSYQLTERDQISASLTLVRNRAIDDKSTLRNASNADRDYGTGTLSYQRRITEEWFLRTSYQYSEQKYDRLESEAESNMLTISVNYRPQQWRWSR